jgi:hypothetical protein
MRPKPVDRLVNHQRHTAATMRNLNGVALL